MRVSEARLAYMLIGGLSFLVLLLYALGTGPVEPGDGILHYQISKWSIQHPALFLDHWGKPFFTLLTAPFAQVGPIGMVVFNVLCFVVGAFAFRRIGKLLQLHYSWMGILFFFCAPIFARMVLAGMTEPLFAVTLLATIMLLIESRFLFASGLFGLAFFMRPEAMIVAPFIVLFILKNRPIALAVMLIPLLIYSVIGHFILGDFLWFVHRDPYAGVTGLYGSGSVWTFLTALPDIISLPLSILAAIGGGLAIDSVRRMKVKSSDSTIWLLLIIGPFISVFMVHSILWWQGWSASMGLVRVMATVTPLASLLAWQGATWILKKSSELSSKRCTGALVLTSIVFLVSMNRLKVPKHIELPNLLMIEALDEAGPITEGGRIFYLDPFVTHHLRLDPFDTAQAIRVDRNQSGVQLSDLRYGDRFIWESQFAAVDGSLDSSFVIDPQRFDVVCRNSSLGRKDQRWGEYVIIISDFVVQ